MREAAGRAPATAHAGAPVDRARALLQSRSPWLALPLGALQSLSFAPFDLYPLGFLCLAGLYWLWRDSTPKRAAWSGFAFAFGLFLAGTYWLYISIHVFGKAPVPLALFLMLGMVAIMGSYAAAVGWTVARFLPREGLLGWLLVLPAAWVGMEWFRGWFLSGFPWLAVGYGQLDTWLAGWAPVLGIYGLSLATAMTAGAVLAVALGGARERVAAGVAIGVLWLGGGALATVEWTRPSGAPIPVALVQGAIPQDLKWQDENRQHTLDLYRGLTEQGWGARIIVWPEATLPVLYHEAIPYLTALYRDAQQHGADLVFGLIRYDFDTRQYRNGLAAFGAHGEQWYFKRRLVPFGEFFPVPAFIREWMRLSSLTYVDFAAGAPVQAPLPAAGELLGPTICYEDAYAAEQLAVLKDATLLVNVSNDAWFGDSTAPHQHLQIARMRSLEAGRWMMRATNNGISAFIDPQGRVLSRSTQFVPEVLAGEVVPHTGLTPYAVVRNWPVLGACAIVLVAGAWRRTAARRAAPRAADRV